jgi:hypothetical protein
MPSEQHEEKHQSDQRGGKPSGKHQQRQSPKLSRGVTTVTTSDPAIKSGPRLGAAPEEVVSYQTSQLSAPPQPYPLEAGGDVVQEQRNQPQGQEGGQQEKKQNDQQENSNQQGEQGKQQSQDEQGKKQGRPQDNQQRGEQRGDGQQDKGQEEHKQPGQQQDRRNNQQDDIQREADQRHKKKKKHRPHRQPASAVNWQSLALSGILALVCGVGGAWGYSAIFGSSKSDKDKSSEKGDKGDKGGKSGGKSGGKQGKSGSGKESGSSEGGASASEIPGFNSAKDADTFKRELEHLAHRVDLLGGRIDRMTQPENQTPPVLHTLQMKMNDLEREVDQVANVPSQMRQLQQKIAGLKEELKTLKERVKGEDLPTGSEFAPEPSGSTDPALLTPKAQKDLSSIIADPADDATLKLAMGLFRERHYSQACEVLLRLRRERPSDARVWYYSALANGLATGDWGNKTKRLVERGIACEQAGQPSREQIDMSLSNLASDLGKEWLAEQRRQISVR